MKQSQQNKLKWRHYSCNSLYTHLDWWEPPESYNK